MKKISVSIFATLEYSSMNYVEGEKNNSSERLFFMLHKTVFVEGEPFSKANKSMVLCGIASISPMVQKLTLISSGL